jgi:hypothetical protein
MANTTNKYIVQPNYNDYAGDPTGWTDPINVNWGKIDAAFGTVQNFNLGSLGAITITLTNEYPIVAYPTPGPASYIPFILNITGAMTGNCIIRIPSTVCGSWVVINGSTGNYTVTVDNAGGGTSVLCRQGFRTSIYSDGTNIGICDDQFLPGGSNTQIQFNNSGALGGSSKMTFDGTTTTIDTLAVTNGATVGGAIVGASTVSDSIGNVRTIPQNSKTAAYALLASDAGKFISITTGGVTINTSIFTVGQNVTIYNNSVSSQTITQGAGVTLRQVGSASTGNRTLAQYGLATLLCVGTDTYVITGGGLT